MRSHPVVWFRDFRHFDTFLMIVLFDTPGGTGKYMAHRHRSMVHNGLHIETVTQLLRTTISEGRFSQHVSVARKILQ